MSGLFSQNNLLLCGMQGNHALLVKTFKKKVQNQLYSKPVLTFDKRQICSASSFRVFEWTLKELRFNTILKNLCLFLC